MTRPGKLTAYLLLGSILTLGPSLSVGAQQQVPPAIVEVAEASTEMMAPQVYMPATVVSLNDSRIAAEITGRVTWVATEGTFLKEGDIIAQIDSRNHELMVARNKTEIKRLEARIEYLKSDLVRLKELVAGNYTPTSRVEEATSALLMAEQELAQAVLNLEQSKIDFERTRVRAPFPGRVVEKLAQIGEYAVPGREIVRLVDTEHLEARAQAPVTLARVLRDGTEVVLRDRVDQANAGGTVPTTYSQIRAVVPVGDELSRTMEIRVNVPEAAGYVVGSALQVGVPSSAPEQVVAVPRDALVLRREGTYIYRVTADNKAERMLVETGAASGARVAITGNIESGDRVIIRGGERLRPGQPLEFKESTREVVTSR